MAQCKLTLRVENNEEVSITFDDTGYLIDKRLNPAIVSDTGDAIYNNKLIWNLYIEEPEGKTVLSTFFENLFVNKKIITVDSFKLIEVENLETNKSFSSANYKIENFGIMYGISTRPTVNNLPNNCVINITFSPKDEVSNA